MTEVPLHTVMNLRLHILSPVHVGAGSERTWNRYMDFTTRSKKVYVFDHEKLFEQLQEEVTEDGKSGLEAYIKRISDAHGKRIDKLLEELDVDLEKINLISFDYRDEPGNEIRPLIRTGEGIPIVPGSSLKGAIRSVLFNHLWNKEGKGARDKEIDNRLLGSFQSAITRYIAPSDVEIKETELTNVALFNLGKPGFDWKSFYKKDSFNGTPLVTCETFKVDAEGMFRLSIANGWFKQIQEAAKDPKYRESTEGVIHYNTKFIIQQENPIQHLFQLINEYTNAHLSREIAFFEEYQEAEHTDFIIHNLRELRKKTQNNARSCILRMSYGIGYHGITGDWKVGDHVAVVDETIRLKIQRDEDDYHLKSRRIAKHAVLTAACMGFVEIFLPEDATDIPFTPAIYVDEPKKQPTLPGVKIVPVNKEAKTTPYGEIDAKKVFTVEILEVDKPFSKVKLLIEDYPFDPIAKLSGTKKVQLQPGMIVEVVVNSRSKEGEIKQVTYWG